MGTGALLVLCTLLATKLGGEFVPTLDEQDVLIQPVRMPGISVDQAVIMQHRVEAAIAVMPEVREVFARLGTAEVANDPMPISTGDTYLILKPRPQRPHPTLPIEMDRRAVARFGLKLADVQGVVRTALSGTPAGELFTGDRRFPIVVRLPEQSRHDVAALEQLPIPIAGRGHEGSSTQGEPRI